MVTKPPYPAFNQFVLALQGHEQTLAAQKEEERVCIEHAQAFFTQHGQGRGGRGNFNSKGRGFTPAGRYNAQNNNSSIFRPFQSNPTKETQESESNQHQKAGKVACQICGKMNHVALDCWYMFDYSYQSEDLPQALAALTLNNNDLSFYVDSGATIHMTNDAVSKFTLDNACIVEFTPSDFVVKDRDQRIIVRGHKHGQLYALKQDFQEALTAIKDEEIFSPGDTIMEENNGMLQRTPREEVSMEQNNDLSEDNDVIHSEKESSLPNDNALETNGAAEKPSSNAVTE
ncbi:hypothetical protein L484_002847 [Morus notabilis]|uniref:CCHC-type domain-containing protein n=1 Tax=Morus notabilis TaxID=981085 RepID=W9RPB3_9ROSA|nr:hypothetical protein L484_002847 [Morus notabilis]